MSERVVHLTDQPSRSHGRPPPLRRQSLLHAGAQPTEDARFELPRALTTHPELFTEVRERLRIVAEACVEQSLVARV